MNFLYLIATLVCAVFIIETSVAEFPPSFINDPLSDVPAGHLKKFGYHRPPEGPVVEERGFLHPKIFWKRYVSVHRPMVFRQAVADSPAIFKWTDKYLVAMYGDLDLLLEVKREDRTTSPQRTNVNSFIERYKKENIYAVTILPDPMREEIQVPSCLLCGTFYDFMHETNFWMSSGGTRSVIHYDADENLHCIINGSKDFMMMANEFKTFLPLFAKKQFTGSGFSHLDPDSINLLQYPDVAKVQWMYTTLFPGDCIYIPSEYLHQVRSHQRTISATMLFTSDVDKSFQDKGCDKANFGYTPLSRIDVHWTYKKGDQTIDMGYINLEFLRKNLLDILSMLDEEYLTLDNFAHFYSLAIQEEKIKVKLDNEEEAFIQAEELFTKVFEVGSDGRITKKQIQQLPRENLKILARSIDVPHGPVAGAVAADLDDTEHDRDEL